MRNHSHEHGYEPHHRHRHPGFGNQRGMGGGRRRRRGDVRSAVLHLLADRDMHGYEMIQEIEERTAGRWRPSAGSIYPTLQLLADEGLVTAEEVDGRRVFSLTDSGRELAAEKQEGEQSWEGSDHDRSPYHRLRREASQLIGAGMQVAKAGTPEQVGQAIEILAEARRKLYSLLADAEA